MITIKAKCDCGNKAELSVPNNKTIVLRDNLERQNFYFDGSELQKGKLCVQCDKCKRWIELNLG